MMSELRRLWGMAMVVAMATATGAWAVVPVFDYQFPASWDGTNTLGACNDLSTAGNHAIIENDPLMYPGSGYAAGERPPGFAAGGSLYGGDVNGPGRGKTSNTNLLLSSLVAANGGFAYDTWVKPATYGTVAPYYIDYAGTETLLLNRSGSSPDYTYRFQFRGRAGWWSVYSDPIDLAKWYHVRVSFDSVGLPALSTGEQPGLAVLVVEDPEAGTSNTHIVGMTKTAYGDSLNRSIGLNRHSNSTTSSNSQGYLFNPKVSLGPDPTINAASLVVPVDPNKPGKTVGHWAFDDAVGATTIVDSGPNGLHGTVVNGVTLGRPGAAAYSGTAIGFNLDQGSDDAVDVPFNALLDSDSFSVAFWMKPDATKLAGSDWQIPVDFRAATTTKGWSVTLGGQMAYNSEILAFVGAGSESWQRLVSSPLTGDAWIHFAMTYDADSDFGRLYMNGVLTGIVVKEYVHQTDNTPLRFGRLNTGTGTYPFVGDLDDVWLFDYALTDAEVAALLNNGTEPHRLSPPTIPGDTNGNNIVDETDAAVLATNWGHSVTPGDATAGDFNGDGLINAADASILAANWGNHNTEGAGCVPEPSVVVMLLGLFGLVCLKRRA